MWCVRIGKVKETQPGKFVPGGTGLSLLVLAGTLAVGLTASTANAGLLGGLGVDVGVDVDVGHGGVGAGVDVGVGIGGGGVGVGVDVGLGTGGGGPGTTPGGPLGPDVIVNDDGTIRKGRAGGVGLAMACAKDGNETAYNGFVVRDRAGEPIGWVHEATVSPNGKVTSVRLQSSGKSCFKLSGGGFRIKGDEVWANVDAVAFR